jgi:FkbM family methyltransferase
LLLFFFKLANKLYIHFSPLYRPLYFSYKRISDRKVIAWLSEQIQPGMRVVDIGGNIGFYSVLLSRFVGERGEVHVFEPDPVNFKHLKSNTKGLKNVVANNSAVAERSGTIRLFHSDKLNVDHQTYDIGENRHSIEIACVRLDDYFHQNERVDFIKIDIQGYEYQTLLGMRETIRRSKPLVIFSEFWPYGLRRAGAGPDAYLALLEEVGFEWKFWSEPEGIDWRKKLDDKDFYTNLYGIRK